MPATRRDKVRLWHISIHAAFHPSETGLLSLTIVNSMADPSTNAPPILDLSLGRHLARSQLRAGIRYVSGASVFMEIALPFQSDL